MVKDNIQNAAHSINRFRRGLRARSSLHAAARLRDSRRGGTIWMAMRCTSWYNATRWESGPTRWEAHRRYIDIQFVISGRQIIGYCDISQLAPDKGYDAERDLEFLSDGDGAHLLSAKATSRYSSPGAPSRPILAPGLDAGACVDMAVFKVLI